MKQQPGQRHQRVVAEGHPDRRGHVVGEPGVAEMADLAGHPPEAPDVGSRVPGRGQLAGQVGGPRPGHRHPRGQVAEQQDQLAGDRVQRASSRPRPAVSGRCGLGAAGVPAGCVPSPADGPAAGCDAARSAASGSWPARFIGSPRPVSVGLAWPCRPAPQRNAGAGPPPAATCAYGDISATHANRHCIRTAPDRPPGCPWVIMRAYRTSPRPAGFPGRGAGHSAREEEATTAATGRDARGGEGGERRAAPLCPGQCCRGPRQVQR